MDPLLSNERDALEALLAQVVARPLRARALDSKSSIAMRARILERTADAAPKQTETIRGASLNWEQFWPGVWGKVLKRDLGEDLQITLLRMQPGSIVPAHEHGKAEECAVLEGELSIGPHRLFAGDLHIARPGSHHPDITTRGGALLLVRAEVPSTV